jgi:hypothetical protein
MNPFAIGWGPAMNKPEKLKLRDVPEGCEVVNEGGAIILRRIVDARKFRRIAADVLAHMPPPKKGASVLRELEKSRLRRGR